MFYYFYHNYTLAFIIFLALLLAACLTIFLNSLVMSSLVISAPGGPRGPVGPRCKYKTNK